MNCTIFGTFTTLHSAAQVLSYKFWSLSPLTGFRKLYGDGFYKDFGEERCSWLEKESALFTDCRLQGLQLVALVEMRPPVPPPGPAYLLNACRASLSNCVNSTPVLAPLIWWLKLTASKNSMHQPLVNDASVHRTKERSEIGIVWTALNVPVICDPPLSTPNRVLAKVLMVKWASQTQQKRWEHQPFPVVTK